MTISTSKQPTIYPQPSVYRVGRQQLTLLGRRHIRLLADHSENFCRHLGEFCKDTPIPLELTYGRVPEEEVLLTIRLKGAASRGERYEISTSKAGFEITAATECGLYRGLCSLKQVLQQTTDKRMGTTESSRPAQVPYVQIEDQPDFSQRGVMLDISRCKVPTLDTLKTLIAQFAALKYNQLQLYTEHTFRFAAHPLVWTEASPLSAADVLELKHYCAAHYIELVPNLNCFGHFERWLRHPEYHKYAECPSGFTHPLTDQHVPYGSTLNPARSSLKLIDSLHAEYLPLFDSPFFNVGGDEPWELGLGRSRKKCAELGTTNVYIDFMSDIQKLVEKRGRQMMFWSDIVLKQPQSLKRLSKELIALNWGYEGNHPFAREAEHVAKQKIPFYVCPGTSSWNSLIGRTQNMRRNIASAARQGHKYNAEGLLVTDWGDHGHHQYLPISYPGFAVGACESWRTGSSQRLGLAELVNRFFIGESDNSTAATIIELGQVLELATSPLRNATIFNRLLFWQMKHEPSTTKHLETSQLVACEQALKALLARPQATDPILAAELRNAIAMAIHSLHRLLYFRREPLPRRQLRAEIKALCGEHSRLWLARNRAGGLDESLGHLQKAAEALL